MQFTHLHVHTQYSLLDGASPIKKLMQKTKELGMDSIAITDHGNMYGAVEFYKAAKEFNIHPVIGCEVYMAPRTRFDKIHDIDNKTSHLILLCENQTGYKNLIKIVSAGFIDGFYYKPRIDFEILREHSEGLIVLSACLGGEIAKALIADDYKGALNTAKKYIEVFGNDNYFIEIQDHGLAEQKKINPMLIRLSKEINVGLVATNDIHYISKEDARYQDVLMCIQTEKTVNDENRMKFDTDMFYLKSPDEMNQLFSYIPEAIENTHKIAQRCNVEFDFNTRYLPSFDVPNGMTSFEYLKKLCYSGLKKRYKHCDNELVQRLDYELGVINKMGFVDYFLIVWDFIHFAKNNGVVVGPGRGSAAGSIVSYCLEITGIDPIKYSLIFERFLNPERISMPDIDIDFEPHGRQKVIDYVVSKYGADQVSQIITFGTMKAKQAVRDVGRALDIPYGDVDKIAKLIPYDLKMTIEKALDISNELKEIYNTDPKMKDLLDTAKALEGLPRHASTHAAGVVITKEPIVNYVPLQRNKDVITTQYEKDTIEQLGLLKMDFLGLRNLTVIDNAVKLIEKNRGIKINIDEIDFNKKEVFDLIGSGNTDGVFQLESAGMKNFMQELKPDCIEDIIAGIAIYRPGPMNQRHQYIHNKKFPADIKYKHPRLESILNVTYGFMVYQEQVLQIVRELAGYSLGSADMMRRVISKKKSDAMEIERRNFIYGLKDENGNYIIDGCIRRGIDEQTAVSIFDEINDFANYAFNKSHAAAYAFISYQTAYLKTFYPVEFMASLISSIEDSDKINRYIENCTSMGINRLPPDINKSDDTFTVEGNGIRFGLSAVKNVGRGLILKVIEERNKRGNFKNFTDFVDRMATSDLNRRALESLISCGAFDEFGIYRSRLNAVCNQVLDGAYNYHKNNIQGQISLFGEEETKNDMQYPQIDEYDKRTLLKLEKEMTGLYFSGHPMEEYADKIKSFTKYSTIDILSSAEKNEDGEYTQVSGGLKDGENITICGIISSRKNKTTKSNSQMAFLEVEDMYGSVEVVVFPKVFAKYSVILSEGEVLVFSGRLSIREDEAPKLILSDAQNINSFKIKKENKVYIKLQTQSTDSLQLIKSSLVKFKGNIPVYFYFEDTKITKLAPKNMWINIEDNTINSLKQIFGEECVKIK